MEFDVFFSLSQTPVAGHMPTEREMFRNFFEEVEAADALGYGVAWLAESHLSSEVQKRNAHPVIPHWDGEVGLNCDMLQSAQMIFQRTAALAAREQALRHTPAMQKKRRTEGAKGDVGLRHGRIEVGSAVMNILQGGGPIAAAERIAYFAALADLDERPGGMSRKPDGTLRRIHVGFSAGRFDYMNRAHGYVPRDALERAIPYPFLKGKIFDEAAEIFARLLRGDTLSSDDIAPRTITEAECRTPEDWKCIRDAAKDADRFEAGAAPDGGDAVSVPKRFVFEELKVVPQDWRRDLVQLVVGSHDPRIQDMVNTILPAHVANLSITPGPVIDQTHERMRRTFHPDGGPWKRSYMPRTVLVFVNDEPGLSNDDRRATAQKEAKRALGAYWNALEGTLDPKKVEGAAENAVIGTVDDVAEQIAERFHPDDRLMLWFDFFNHDAKRVVRDMTAFMDGVGMGTIPTFQDVPDAAARHDELLNKGRH